MIKVLKAGEIKKTTCTFCGAILSYEDIDVIKEENKIFSIPPFNKTIICPCCEEKIIVDWWCTHES